MRGNKTEGVMNEISNISPAAIPVPRSTLLNISGNAGELGQAAVSNSLSTTSVSAIIANSDQQLTPETVSAAVEAGNTILKATNKNLSFKVDDTTKQVVISIVDSVTGDVIRQIPTVEMLDFMRAMALQETNSGKLLQAKA